MTDTPEYRAAESERRIENLIRIGVVDQADYGAGRVRVKSGDLLTGWIPWLTRRASNDSDWWAPEVGEQGVLLCPCGDPAQGVFLPAIYQGGHPAPESRETIHRTVYADGTSIEYDRASGILKVDCVNQVEIVAAARVTVRAGLIELN